MSFTDSFLDFEAIKNWFDGNPNPNMADVEKDVVVAAVEVDSPRDAALNQHVVGGSDPVSDASVPVVRVEDEECPMMVQNASCSIEDDLRKVSLVVGESGERGEVMDVNDEKRGLVGVEIGNVVGIEESGIVDGSGEKREAVDGDGEGGARSGADGSGSSESDSESTSSSSSSSSGSSSEDEEDNDVEAVKEKEENAGEVEEGEIREEGVNVQHLDGDEDVDAMFGWSDAEDEDGGYKGPIRSKNEAKILPPVPPVDATLLPHHQMVPVGVVLSIVGTQVVVEGIDKHSPLSDGSILWITEPRSPLGLVDEIFGPVKNPYYIVRYNSEAEVPAGLSTGMSVSFVPEFASHVLNNKDIYKKGYDASGENDEEMSDEGEFSDDEKEAEHKRMLKCSKRGTKDPKPRKNKNNRKSFDSRVEPWSSSKPSPHQTPIGTGHGMPNQHHPHPHPHPHPQPQLQPHFLPRPTSAGFAPNLPPIWPNAAPPTGVWPNGMPFQHPQGAFFPSGFPMNNNMMWPPQNPQQFPYQMPMPSGVPFNNQQVNPNQSVLPGQQNNFSGIPFGQGQGFMGQNSFNTLPFGGGLQGQPPPPALNFAEQGNTSTGLPMGQEFSMSQSGDVLGNNDAPQQFNPGRSGRGRGSYRRGGGRFSRGRGRKQ